MRNLYKALKELLPAPAVQVGTVVAYAGGVATIELPGGGTDQARGDADVGQRVFFRAGAIEGLAPDLPVVTVDV